MPIPKEVTEFLAFKIVSNVRELEGALNRIIAHATLVGREISLETTQEVLRDLLKSNDRRLTIEDIQNVWLNITALKFQICSRLVDPKMLLGPAKLPCIFQKC